SLRSIEAGLASEIESHSCFEFPHGFGGLLQPPRSFKRLPQGPLAGSAQSVIASGLSAPLRRAARLRSEVAFVFQTVQRDVYRSDRNFPFGQLDHLFMDLRTVGVLTKR